MKKVNLTAIPLLFAAAGLCAEGQQSQTMDKQQASDQQMMMKEITPSGEPKVSRCADPYLTADFIWWRAQEDGLEYAANGITDGNHSAHKGALHHPHFKYEPGFKVGAGLKFKHDGWDLYAQYTWLHTDSNKRSVHAKEHSHLHTNIFVPESDGQLRTFRVHEAEAKWNLHFNVLDLELGRDFWISKYLTLRPFVGMKFSWNDQDFDVEYEKQEGQGRRGFNKLKLDMDLDQSAVGLRSGLDTAWFMWKKWCIFGNLALSGMWNDFDSHRKDHWVRNDGHSVTFNNVHRDVHSVTAVLEWALGLRFQTAFHNDDFMFMLQAGWEEQIWFNQNQFVMMPNSTPANLTLEGLTIKAGFYF